ncbi:S-layer domain-containing protein [Syntrophobotulus glycolicus DSM 8271]|uniref:S-layer domain-containing protein n=1 Tax=Syntrophobotulus glycolicus (strain DSM 8271 / FlGlyR) TaxID=645991 RepID=F0STS4_SYNGF|nr:Ig-like domain-containing protein [Syntrophobotulus glycolicus]ADY55364.1 S-layer domain-containing protein [Syntrophobotulus glycolicus DSM 8271]
MKKRMLSLLLAVAMVVTLLPVTAWAEEVSPVQESGEVSAPVIGESIATDSNAGKHTVSENTLSVSVSSVTDSGAELAFTSSVDGTVSYLVQKSDEAAPDEAAVLAGKTVAATTGAAITAELTGLTAETDYTVYALLESGSGSRSALASAQFTTEAATPLLLRAGRAAGTTPYVDEHGVEHTETATEISSATTGLNDTTTGGWYVVSGNVSTGTLTVNGDVKLILADGASLTVTGSGTKAGVLVNEGNSLTIYGQVMGTGRLDAMGGDSGAGIGTDKDGALAAGIVNIYGGTVIARSGGGVYGSAGIGGGHDSSGGTVNIYGGSVTATGEKGGAGIGGGNLGSGGSVNIYGGTVTATGGTYGAGIGGGYLGNSGMYGNGCTVNIYGGTVKATGGSTGAGIGGGYHGNGGSVNIHGGWVEATGGTYGAGIGAGQGGSGDIVKITGGTVTAAGGSASVDIGGTNGTITITGGTVTASRFSSADTAAPTIQSVSPNDAGAAISGNLAIAFSEAMMPSVGIISLDNGVGALTGGSWDTDRKVYTVPYSSLTRSTEYIVSISGFYDVAGNAMTADASHRFTTEPEPDTTNPTVASVAPSGANAPISGNMTVTFSEAMNTSAGTVSLDGGITSLTGGSWTVGSTVYTVPYALLGYSTEYTLSISGFEDTAGNPMTADNSHSFTTITAPDTTSPTVINVTPSGVDTAIGGNIVITFSEAMNTSAGTVSLDGGATSLAGGSWTVGGTVYTAPYSLLGYSTAYTLSISGFEDVASNPMTANTSHSFTTIAEPDTTRPTVVSVTPNGTNTAIRGNIIITFSEAMNTSAGTVSLDGGITSLTGGSWTVGNTVYTVPYSLLGYSTAYTLSISGFEDMAGNTMTADISHSFTTITAPDTTSPTVINVTPRGVDTAIGGNIVITFSESMNTSAGTVSLDGGITSLMGGSWTVGSTVYTVPYARLGYSMEYTLSISGFEDTAGNPMTADTSHRFTTVAEPRTPSVSANTLTVNKGATASFTVSLGQGVSAATAADITVANGSIASVSTGRVTASGTVTVTGLAAGTTGIIVTFHDSAQTVKNIAVTVNAVSDRGNRNRGYSSSSGSSSATISEKQPDYPVTAEISVTATADKNGHATATIPESAIADAIKKAATAAKSQGKTENGISISVTVNTPANTKSLGLVLSQSVLKQFADTKVQQFEVNGQLLTFSLDQEAIRQLLSQSTGDVTVTVKPVTVAGVRNAYEITFTTVKDGKTVTITSLGSGNATLSIPCLPEKNEAAGYLYAVYVDAKGKRSRIPGSAYDANSRSVIFNTNHFSVYGVGYEEPSANFTDIGSHWAKESIDYVVGRGLFSGTSQTTFAPDKAMTRGMLVTALGKLAGVDVKAYTTNSFTDVKADSAFRPYIEWADKKGVVQGIGNGKFEPDRAITREEIAVIFANFAKGTGYKLPVTREAAAYADVSSIGSAYKTAVIAMQQAGIMTGETNNKFNPKSNATCAEASAMLHRYIKLTIDPATTQGWAQNDAGQYLYYKDGKALTGWQTIDGTKYFFNTDSTLKTGWVKNENNWRYYTGNKAAVGWLDISDKRYYFTKDGLMVSGRWLEIGGKWYYFNADGSLARNTKIGEYEVDETGVRKTK